MSAEHIDPEVIEAAYELLPREPDREDVEAAIRAAFEKRRELAQADPEGQEYAYRVCHRTPRRMAVPKGPETKPSSSARRCEPWPLDHIWDPKGRRPFAYAPHEVL